MINPSEFQQRVQNALAEIDQETLSYNEDEFWLIRTPYELVRQYADDHQYFNTAIALRLARGLHNGAHRKHPVLHDGIAYKSPYMIHCLTVCRMLMDLHIPVSAAEEDTMLAAALCHDLIEDIPFPEHGAEITTHFHLAPEVYELVRLVSKRRDFSEDEEADFFHAIARNRLALLIKLSDRGHNVTDLYNMSDAKLHEYICETRKYFLPMCQFGRIHYPELEKVLEILQDQLIVLTKTADVLVDRFAQRRQALIAERDALLAEHTQLLEDLRNVRSGGIS